MLLLLIALVLKGRPTSHRAPIALLATTLSMAGPLLLSTVPWGAESVPAQEPRRTADAEYAELARSDSGAAAMGLGAATGREGANRSILREGTRIPPTTGRFIMQGRRWAFVSDDAMAAQARSGESGESSLANAGSLSEESSLSGESLADRLATNSSLTTSREAGAGVERRVPFPARRPLGSESGIAATADDTAITPSPPGRLVVPQMLVSENLLLQRIVDAVRDDTLVSRWTVTGVVTEYFGENRLILHTAQRADGR